jgi:hypothetical protein
MHLIFLLSFCVFVVSSYKRKTLLSVLTLQSRVVIVVSTSMNKIIAARFDNINERRHRTLLLPRHSCSICFASFSFVALRLPFFVRREKSVRNSVPEIFV